MGLRDRVKRGARRAIERFSESGSVSRPPVYRSEIEPTKPFEAANGAEAEVQEIPEHIATAIREPTEEVESPEVEAAPAPVAEEEEEVFDGEPVDEETAARIHEEVVCAIKTVFDPEIPVNIYELGLIYEVAVRPGSVVTVRMTLTSPNCPAAQTLPEEVKQKSAAVEGVNEARVKVVWEPTWGPQLMSEAAQLELNLM